MKHVTLGCVLLAFVAGNLSAQNLLLNPSFESGSFVDSGNGFMSLSGGNTSLTSWEIPAGIVTISWGTTPNSTNIVPSAGIRCLNLAGFHDAPWTSVRQSVNLTAGKVYRLAFDLGTQQSDPQLAAPAGITFSVGSDLNLGLVVTGQGTGMQWGRIAMNFTASVSGPAYVTFTGNTGTRFIGLDNAELRAVSSTEKQASVDMNTWIPAGSNNFTGLPTAPSLSVGSLAIYGTGSGGQQGIYRFYPPTPIHPPDPVHPPNPIRVADLNTAIPNGTGNFTAFGPVGFPPTPVISGNNTVFYGEGSGGQKGIYITVPPNPIFPPVPIRVADTSTAIPNGTGNFTGFHPPVPVVPPEPVISGNNIAFWGLGASSQGIYMRLSGNLTRVADTGTAIPGGTGNFTGFPPNPVISGNNVAFLGNGSSGQQGVYVAVPPTPVVPPNPVKVADVNTAIPGGTGNFTGFTTIAVPPEPIIPPDPVRVAFVGLGAGGQQGVYVGHPPTPVHPPVPIKVADLNTRIPGGTGQFTGFSTVAIAGDVVAFVGTGSGGQSGLYALRSGSVRKVVAVGDVVDSKTVSSVAFAATGLSDTTVAYTLGFTDGSAAVDTEEVSQSGGADDFHITGVTRTGADLQLSHTTLPGFQYLVEAKTNLVGGTWSVLSGTNTGTGLEIQLVKSNAFGIAREFYRARLLAGSYASDSAADATYGGAWTNGYNGGVGFGPWTLTTSTTNGTFFLGFSTNNFTFASPGIDVGGVSWGINANNGANAAAYRAFSGGPLPVGAAFAVSMDNGLVNSASSVGFALRNGNATSSATDYNTGARFQFLFVGGGGNYQVVDSAGQHALAVALTGTGKRLLFELTGTNTYTLLTIDNASGATNTVSGNLAGSGTVDSLSLFNRNAGPGSDHDCYFNSLQIMSP